MSGSALIARGLPAGAAGSPRMSPAGPAPYTGAAPAAATGRVGADAGGVAAPRGRRIAAIVSSKNERSTGWNEVQPFTRALPGAAPKEPLRGPPGRRR